MSFYWIEPTRDSSVLLDIKYYCGFIILCNYVVFLYSMFWTLNTIVLLLNSCWLNPCDDLIKMFIYVIVMALFETNTKIKTFISFYSFKISLELNWISWLFGGIIISQSFSLSRFVRYLQIRKLNTIHC